ncbi:hypothetical protein PCC7424_2945 [Gloeothece citriformis PCC 7424]|uniref:Uncharacterized protein n=1 Tax=Gloeothece citriformis (strain PCC 7424) TaxID=65393 RepID=B7K9Z3_GLOC7|nr:hypothetical protein [Gloeothece citriformis]ACK71349.1 hypothetical protein PCC7424_2945 [Gloeothece citriformis PCC 7424]
MFFVTVPTWKQSIPSQHLAYQTQSEMVILSLDQQNLVNEYHELLNQVKIPISYEQCEQQPGLILYGYYDRIDNLMVLCKDAIKQSHEYVETLVHESWHAVQDCIDGLDNSEITPFLTKDPDLLTMMLNNLTPTEVENILHNYEKVDQAYEIEAFFLQKYPNLVLKGLNTCVIQAASG